MLVKEAEKKIICHLIFSRITLSRTTVLRVPIWVSSRQHDLQTRPENNRASEKCRHTPATSCQCHARLSVNCASLCSSTCSTKFHSSFVTLNELTIFVIFSCLFFNTLYVPYGNGHVSSLIRIINIFYFPPTPQQSLPMQFWFAWNFPCKTSLALS